MRGTAIVLLALALVLTASALPSSLHKLRATLSAESDAVHMADRSLERVRAAVNHPCSVAAPFAVAANAGCTLAVDNGQGTRVDNAMFAQLKTCAALIAALGAGSADSLSRFNDAWLVQVTHTPHGQAAAHYTWGQTVPAVANNGLLEVTLRAIVHITVLQNSYNPAAQATRHAWVPPTHVHHWDDELVLAVNNVLAVGNHPRIHGGNTAGTNDAVLEDAGAVMAWGAVVNPAHVIRIEHFPGGITQAMFPDPLGGANTKMATGTDEVFYFNAITGRFVGVAQARTDARTAFVAASGVAAGVMTPTAVLATLSDDGSVNSASRTLKRALEVAHGRGDTHFGFAYYTVTLRVYKTIAGSPLTKVIGWLSAADNSAAMPRRHTEQHIFNDLRLFVNALEAANAATGARMVVTALASRWVTDFFPDTNLDHNCEWAFQWHRHMARNGWFRVAEFDNNSRNRGRPPAAGAAATRTAGASSVYAQATWGNAGAVIAYTDPVAHYVYATGGAPAINNNQRKLAAVALAQARLAGSVPNAADEIANCNAAGDGRGTVWNTPPLAP